MAFENCISVMSDSGHFILSFYKLQPKLQVLNLHLSGNTYTNLGKIMIKPSLSVRMKPKIGFWSSIHKR